MADTVVLTMSEFGRAVNENGNRGDSCSPSRCRVVSKPAADCVILDCGSKTLTNDQVRGITKAASYGAVLTGDGGSPRQVDETLTIERLSEEHATVRVAGGTRLQPGDRVRVLPNHSCVVSNMVDVVRLVEGDRVVDTLPVAARGRIT